MSHVLRRRRNHWRCTCGQLFTTDMAAERHAFDTLGRVEMGRAS